MQPYTNSAGPGLTVESEKLQQIGEIQQQESRVRRRVGVGGELGVEESQVWRTVGFGGESGGGQSGMDCILGWLLACCDQITC